MYKTKDNPVLGMVLKIKLRKFVTKIICKDRYCQKKQQSKIALYNYQVNYKINKMKKSKYNQI
ncbi:hypothetical protein DI032_16860 [Legionella pneumophila]|uniref:Uncharacterized protein n=1 Tax=Legionella pneumophila subsp. pneumophila TaxID=91891 RepID=A0A3A6UQX3_LEGPN|nr:hypothetical protein A9P84_01025 [Legionella pneumophila]ERB40612.1 hypothetical protein N748_13260 [Legionella pneumophila str. 121004]ERH41181.1 hypothetical protein N750_17160 [Legionella pneumophila str. Leg01/53]ERH41367.1 hypothetical protein N751_17180 [Legionella pneumophila str. Leg01/11]ERI46689.1 hypothetical protein N749_16945 [Legionella pneumophila str. Leg01/20]RJY25562.1 hypothetical protein D1H99_11305 [Legionella pneumophila subsp. pneumophila]